MSAVWRRWLPALLLPFVFSPAVVSAADTPLVIPAGTVLEVEVLDTVTSRTAKPGDTFRLRIAAPLKIGEQLAVPANADVVGQVVHAERSRIGGKPGELILAARRIELPSGAIRLKSSFGTASFGMVGADKSDMSLAVVASAGVFGLVVRGGETTMDAGTRLSVRTAADATVTAVADAIAAPVAAPVAADFALPTPQEGAAP